MFKNMKISKKLIITFIFVAIISSIGSVTALTILVSLNKDYHDTLTNYGFAQGTIGRFNAEFNIAHGTLKDVINKSDPQEIQANISYLEQSSTKLNGYFKDMQKTMVNAKERDYYNSIKTILEKYNTSRDKIISLVQQNKKEEALTLFNADGETYSNQIIYSLYALISAKTTTGNQLTSAFSKQVQNAALSILAVIIISLVVSIVIALRVSHSVSRPVKEMVGAANRVAAGDLSAQTSMESKNEIGQLNAAFTETISKIREYITNITVNLSEIAKGDLTVTSTLEFEGDFIELKESIHNVVTSFNDAMTLINQASEQVSTSAEQVSGGAQSLAQGAAEQASSVEELSATITEISSQVKDNATYAANASRNVTEVSKEIETSNKYMNEMVNAMSQIDESSSEIGKIIKAIEDIAFQTNILALNAAVEAARAGAAGKGFAVVADEVRNLASKSAEAAKDTTALIENSMRQVESGTKIADETAQSLRRVVTSAEAMSETVQKISEATNRQSNAIGQVTLGMEQISSVVQTNSATAEESAAASEELSGQAQVLKELVNKFKLQNQSPETANMQTVTPVHSEAAPEDSDLNAESEIRALAESKY